ncbi:MAG: DUF2752 domain-containing protein [Phycisphaeraceae bacterium]
MHVTSSVIPPASWPARGIAAGVLAICLSWLLVGVQLEANPYGSGTHQQLGLGQCSFQAERGYACPTCGMTTAFTLATHGRLMEAAIVQPAGALLALALAMTAWIAGIIAFTGARLEPFVQPLARRWRSGLLLIAFVLIAGWLTRLAAG